MKIKRCNATLRYGKEMSLTRRNLCSRRAAPNSEFCAQHDPAAVAERDERNKLSRQEAYARGAWANYGQCAVLKAALVRINMSGAASAAELRQIAREALAKTWKDHR